MQFSWDFTANGGDIRVFFSPHGKHGISTFCETYYHYLLKRCLNRWLAWEWPLGNINLSPMSLEIWIQEILKATTHNIPLLTYMAGNVKRDCINSIVCLSASGCFGVVYKPLNTGYGASTHNTIRLSQSHTFYPVKYSGSQLGYSLK